MAKLAFQFRIELEDTEPLIWRQILVPESYTFWDLHVAIQDSMGWSDCHLHQFKIKNEDKIELIGIPDEMMDENLPHILPCWDIPITKYFTKEGITLEYEYDFGDSWIHQVQLEKIIPQEIGRKYPVCIAGEKACPPEDCGGVPGFYHLLDIISDPKNEEYEEMIYWLGEGYNSDHFDLNEVKFENPKNRLKILFEQRGL